jgi:hypothetical protein
MISELLVLTLKSSYPLIPEIQTSRGWLAAQKRDIKRSLN